MSNRALLQFQWPNTWRKPIDQPDKLEQIFDFRKKPANVKNFQVQRRPVEVSVNRIYARSHSTDLNNNQARVLIHPVNPVPADVPQSAMLDLPPISFVFSMLQILCYFCSDYIHVQKESDVYVSWKTVIENGEVLRLFYAQFFHFGKVMIFFNVVSLMALGRFLEKKIKPAAYATIIMLMSVVSNLLYIFLNDIFCSGPHNEYTVGFSTAMFSLRMIHIFVMDSDGIDGKGDPNLIFGFLPVYLPRAVAPWQPVLETIFFDVFIIGRCVASNVSGMLAGLLFPYLMKNFRNYIMYPRNPPPPPPRTEARNRDRNNNNNNNETTGVYRYEPNEEDFKITHRLPHEGLNKY